jgi:hypothetical protein
VFCDTQGHEKQKKGLHAGELGSSPLAKKKI